MSTKELLTVAAIGLFTWTTLLTYNSVRTYLAKDISKDTPEPSGRWFFTNAGLQIGWFGGASTAFASSVARGTSTGNEITGYSATLMVSIPRLISVGTYTASNAGGAVKWFMGQLPRVLSTLNQVGDPGIITTSNVRAVLDGIKQFAEQAGGTIKSNIGPTIQLYFGGGMMFGADEAGKVVGLSVGISAQWNFPWLSNITLGGYAEGFMGLNVHRAEPNGAFYFGAGMGIGYMLPAETGPNVDVALSLFLPTNMPDWTIAEDI